MKYNKSLILSLIMITILSFGCKKENNVQPKTEVSAKDKAITQKIVNFKTKLLSYKDTPNAKDGVVMPIDSAVWYSEALLNYSYCNAAAGFNNFVTVSDTISVPSANGQVTYNDLYNTYTQMETLLTEQENSLQNPNVNLVLADIESLVDSTGKSYLVVTSGYSDSDTVIDPTGNISFWDVARVIQNRYNNGSVPYDGYYVNILTAKADFQGCSILGTHSFLFYYFINQNDPTPPYDNKYDYRILMSYQGYPNFHVNFSPGEVNFYSACVPYIIHTELPQLFPQYLTGKSYISMIGQGFEKVDANTNLKTIGNVYYIKYGTFVSNIQE